MCIFKGLPWWVVFTHATLSPDKHNPYLTRVQFVHANACLEPGPIFSTHVLAPFPMWGQALSYLLSRAKLYMETQTGIGPGISPLFKMKPCQIIISSCEENALRMYTRCESINDLWRAITPNADTWQKWTDWASTTNCLPSSEEFEGSPGLCDSDCYTT